MRTVRALFCVALVLLLVFSPVSPKGLIPFSNASDIEEISDYQEWTENQNLDRSVLVKAGATLVIGKGVRVNFSEPGLEIKVYGNLYVRGTLNDPVYIGSDLPTGGFFSVSSFPGSNVMMRNAEMSGGGSIAYMVQGPLNTVSAATYRGALHISGGKADIQNVTFKHNKQAVFVSVASADVRVNRSRFIENEMDVYALAGDDFRYNWWGVPDGPRQICETYGSSSYCYYETIDGNFDHSKSLHEESFRDPVIVIPGIMGSFRMAQGSDLELDPVLGTYDDLLETFQKNGYTTGVNLFPFPYEWHASNIETAKLLKAKVESVKTQTGWPKVDIVAHSMGGLVAREYIETLNGGSSIDQLVTLGTPHNGAPKSYLMWDGGAFSSPSRFSVADSIANKFFRQEAEENGYDSVFDYVRRAPISSVGELLPIYSYLKDSETSTVRTYPDLYPKNVFLENLAKKSNIDKLNPIEFVNIIGKTSGDETIQTIRVGGPSIALLDNPENIILWGHGEPDGWDRLVGDRGLEIGSGDGTVPYESGRNIIADTTLETESNHGDLPSDAAKTIIKTLTNIDAIPDTLPFPGPSAYLLIMPFSPIDLQIISPSNQRVGKNFETGEIYNEIPGAFYTGYHTQNEFITIPNPEDGKYRVLTQGTDTGPYRIEITHIGEGNQPNEPVKESTVTLSGTAESEVMTEEKIEVVDESVTLDQPIDTIPPITSVAIVGTLGTNGWHTSDMTVTLTAMDDMSDIEKTEYSINGGASVPYDGPFTLSDERITEIRYFSTDKQGNQESEKIQTIKIDKTAPEAKVSFNSITQKLDISGTDALSDVSIITINKPEMAPSNKKVKNIKAWFSKWHNQHKKNLPDMLTILTDEAGHTTSLSFEKMKDRNGFVWMKLQSIAYDDGEPTALDASLQYRWKLDRKGKYQLLAAQARNGDSRLESHYLPKQNETWIMERPEDLREDDQDEHFESRPVRKKLPGMVVPYVEMDRGEVRVGY